MSFFDDIDDLASRTPPQGLDVAPRPGEVARLAPLQLRPVELASEGLIQLWREAARTDLVTILLPDAIRTLGTIIRDPHASPAARVSACKTVLAEALADRDQAATRKALHEMSAAEIEAALYALRGEIDVREGSQGAELAIVDAQTVDADWWAE